MWAIDLGTTNTSVARWDTEADCPRLLSPEKLCRARLEDDPTEAPRVIPSATEIIVDPGFWGRVGRWGPMVRHCFWGKLAYIGREAVDRNDAECRAGFVPSFKQALGTSPLRTLARPGGRSVSARDVTWHFLRELLAAVKAETGERIRDIVIANPVDAYESYRAELQAVAHRLGVRRVRFLDEPVAAALGYGLAADQRRHVLVVDFGGGTLDLALVELDPRSIESGGCLVVAKAGRPLGGDVVDGWLLEEFCQKLEYPLTDPTDGETSFWRRLMLREACRVKEAVFFAPRATFEISPPEELRRFEARLRGEATELEISRQDVVRILTERGLYRTLDRCLDQVLAEARAKGIEIDHIEDVLMVGGSTLLPDVFTTFEARFGRSRVRAWQPFEAVAYGACAYSAGRIRHADFIVHDYALLTYHPRTGEPEYTVIVPRGTRFPTAPDLWKRQLVPTCALGEPERFFKLVVCEIGDGGEERTFGWDEQGILHKLGGQGGGAEERLVVRLNETNPTLGNLSPPHPPSDRRPRLELSFGVNAERWLCGTVVDLWSKKHLMRDEPVVRLL
jgi:molecular chaperone DnaK